MSITALRERFEANTNSFPLLPEFESPGGIEDSLIRSARRYYLLLPIEGMGYDWSEVPKTKRRRIIREHLESVCQSVTKENIKEVDLWLTTMSAPRDQLIQFGRTLQNKYGRLCFICGKHIVDSITVDHIFPYSRGGATQLENLILAHRKCNSAKGNFLPGEMMRWAPDSLSSDTENIEARLRYLVFLRDGFACQENGCSNSLFSGCEIHLKRKHPTGLACYDNLETRCNSCSTPEIN